MFNRERERKYEKKKKHILFLFLYSFHSINTILFSDYYPLRYDIFRFFRTY